MFKQNFLTEVKNMKAFTMIELIFVIVILGILAAVAIPRLAATRDDAEVVKAVSNVRLAIQDVGGFYLAKGYFSENISEMTNVDNPIMVKTEVCATFTYRSNTEMVLTMNTGGTLCRHVWNNSSLRNMANVPVSDGIVFVETR